jgi:predicted ferric reductase
MLTVTRPAPAGSRPLSPPTAPVRQVPRRAGRVLPSLLLAANTVLIVTWWLTHGGASRFGTLRGDLSAVGQLAALLGALAVLVLLTMISRVPWLERRYGQDHLNHWHRWAGITAMTLLTTHVIASTLAFAATANTGLARQIADFILYYPNLLAAIAGFVLLVLVAATSARAVRRRLRYETWWLLHVYAYLAVAISFAHQITLGTDLAHDPWAKGYWIVLFAGTLASLLGYRWLLPIARAFRYRLHLADIREESPGVVTLTLEGRGLHRLRVEAGQYFLLRFLLRDRWWKAHPFSLSAAPDGRRLCFTVKALGDDTATLAHLPLGTPVMAEGPYGVFTAARAASGRVLLIGGGIGIAPITALIEELPQGPGEVAVLYRTRRREEAPLLEETAVLARSRGYLFFVSYSRGTNPAPDPLRPEVLRQAIPDIATRTVFVCGPTAMIEAARVSLRRVGVPRFRIVYERFGY